MNFLQTARYSSTMAIREWTFEQVKHIISSATKSTILVDVREGGEYATGSIPTAISHPLSQINQWRSNPPQEPIKAVVFFCERGLRARQAAEICQREKGWPEVGVYGGSMGE